MYTEYVPKLQMHLSLIHIYKLVHQSLPVLSFTTWRILFQRQGGQVFRIKARACDQNCCCVSYLNAFGVRNVLT